ncbi:Small-conductance mechanosensitive channel [Halogranum amylolyticum]|uniref:Small-conductance mechanosensitive channel n=1 Tax=Halogranum amylolyticum TaxID=660520 RepID=A0A1H8PHH9_9EURY|nr:mechanosensitive ion channel domain-containing protein [Halogranum amylolyticum]SEO40993.1 Small-conductance mechanosensitive channel [Halogranum amylolyticum]
MRHHLGSLSRAGAAVVTPGPEALADYWPDVVRAAWFAAGLLVVLLLGLYVLEPILARAVRNRNRNNPTLQEAVSRYFQLVVLVVAVYVGAGVAGYSSFLTNSALVVAAATLAVGVAAQTVIGSLISGLVLVADPEFNVGDYVQWADGEGTVRSITLRVTRVQTPSGALVTVPNTVLTGQSITRPYRHGRYQVVERVQFAYEDDVDEALSHLTQAAAETEHVLDAPDPNAYVEELGSDAVVARVHYWIDNPIRRDLLGVRSAYIQSAKARFEAAGLTISPASKRDLEGRIDVETTDANVDVRGE